MKSVESLSRVHPVVIFWLGLLTGALLVGFLFLYRALNNDDYKSSLLKFTLPSYQTTSLGLNSAALNNTYMPTPTPN